MSSSSLIGRSAVVIGAGMAGLAAAQALAESFEQVVVLERDGLQPEPEIRPGAPQSRHIHVMLAGGLRALCDLLPDFESALLAAGALQLTPALVRWEIPGYDPFPQRDFPLRACSMSRCLIERTLRREVSRHRSIVVCGGCRVLNFMTDGDRSSVTGLRFEHGNGTVDVLPADLVVDASGRGVPTLAHLQSVTGAVPEATSIGVDTGYATAAFDIPDDAPGDWAGVRTMADPPSSARRGLLMPIEGKRWLVGLMGRRDDKPPGDWDGYFEFAKHLRTPTIFNAIRRAKPAAPILRFRFPASVRRHFERLDRFPRGLLPIGDAICRFNPVWGQGMSVAAQQALLLRDLLLGRASQPDPLDGLAETFFRSASAIVDAPWQFAAVPDLAYPDLEAERPSDFERTIRFGAALRRLASMDADVHKLMFEVAHLLRPATALNEPSLVERVAQMA